MKKIYYLIVLFGALLFCACEKENADLLIEDQTQLEESALKGVYTNGHFKVDFVPPFPYWARMGAGATLGIPSTDEFGIVYFYVDNPEISVDPDFNLLNFYQFPDYSVDPPVPGPWDPSIEWSVEGYLWFEAGSDPNIDIPFIMHFDAVEAVTFWIITRDQVETLFESGVVRISDLLDCDPMVGMTTNFNEVLRPWGGGAPVAGIQTSAQGVIVDGILNGNEIAQPGTKFNFKYHTKSREPMVLEKSEVKFKLVGK